MAIVFVHGGVSGTAKEAPDLAYAARAGAARTSALDAVETAARQLEDDPALNAGFGACLARDGTLELDAGIAIAGRCGGVANVRVRHPITLARRVLEETPHALITGRGAALLGEDMELLDDTTPEQRRRWEEASAGGELGDHSFGAPEHVDTVGAVALGPDGALAAGSSTGGVFGKLPGRVGDAPINGAGIYVSAEVAVVGTGVGETFIEVLASARVARLVEDGIQPQEACERVVVLLARRGAAAAGLLALDADGRCGAAYAGASWAVWGDEAPVEAVSVRP
ncbi:MAG TPA: isoaspartyl peptidase/L-asparaginase [Actinomycetota bacterium]|jgi:L-asparaginase / beta-aspartyl-peptidase|nr:isoaspartyl peptidase/L-asparaginase [Actinomycetota bacterium]